MASRPVTSLGFGGCKSTSPTTVFGDEGAPTAGTWPELSPLLCYWFSSSTLKKRESMEGTHISLEDDVKYTH